MPRSLKRYNLVVPSELFEQVERIADERHATVVEVLKKFIRLGLILEKVEKSPDSAIILREGDSEREIILV